MRERGEKKRSTNLRSKGGQLEQGSNEGENNGATDGETVGEVEVLSRNLYTEMILTRVVLLISSIVVSNYFSLLPISANQPHEGSNCHSIH